jgi:CubicO group peptidase (beta-lactamase class C family)
MNTDRVRQVMEDVAAAGKVPGLCIAIAGPDGMLHADAVGLADLAEGRRATIDDQYLWFSMSKIATATAAVRLHADGLLDLDAPIGTYLSDYRPHPQNGHPTTRQLLTHTAGLGNPLPISWVRPEGEPVDPAWIERVLARHGTPRRAVGGQAAYSNIGYLLAAHVMEAVTRRPIQDCVTERVLQPLGMHSTGYAYGETAPRSIGHARIPRATVPLLRWALPRGIVGPRVAGQTTFQPFLVDGAGYGGLVGSVSDAARLAAAHAAGDSNAHPVLSDDDIRTMRTITATGKRFDHGIGWFRKPADAKRSPVFVEHYGTGAGFWNAMRIYPDLGLAMVAMTNTTFTWGHDRLFTRLEELHRS